MEDKDLERIKELKQQISDMQNDLEQLKRKVDWELQNYNKQHNTEQHNAPAASISVKERIKTVIPRPDYTKIGEQGAFVKAKPGADTEYSLETGQQISSEESRHHIYSSDEAPIKDLENRWGEYIMGILASVLIFAGLILFVSLLYSRLTDVLKTVTIFVISTLLLLAGLFCRRRKNNAFAKSLTACGIGAFYISILVTYFRFELVSQIGMYLLITLWLVGTAFLSKKLKSSSAAVIGQIGITASVIMGSFIKEDIGKIYFLLFFFLVTCLFYQMLFKNHTSHIVRLTLCALRLIACIGFVIGYGDAAFDYMRHLQEPGTAAPFFAGATLLVLYLYALYILFLQDISDLYKRASVKENTDITGNDKNLAVPKTGHQVAYGIFQVILLFCSLALISNLMDIYFVEKVQGYTNDMEAYLYIHSRIYQYSLGSWGMILSITIFWLLTEWRNKISTARIVSVSCCAVLFTGFLAGTDLFFDISRTALLWTPVLIYGFLKKEKTYQIIGIALLAGNAFFLNSSYFLINAGLLYVGVAALLIFLYFKKELYNVWYKLAAYLLSIGCLYSICRVILEEMPRTADFPQNRFYISVAFFLVTSLINLLALYSPFSQSFSNPDISREKPCYITLRVLNGILWVMGMTYLHDTYINLPTQLFLIVFTGVLAFVGTKEWITKRKSQMVSGFYLGIKNTIFLWAVCASFEQFNHIMLSILFLVISILCILAGFRLAMKSFRIYGLVLSMVSIVKLLLFDFQYSDTIGRVAAFFIAGILCFIINFIYSYLNRGNNQK